MSDAGFYRAFEDLHRGSRELIQSRLEVYLPFVRPAVRLAAQGTVADLGCGRGEWLELLKRNGIAAQGVDLDEGMLAACRERGLDVRSGDALEFLRLLPDASQCVVSGFHIAEHLPFPVLQAVVEQALRVLRPGGLLILETPNPENLAVGASGFYMDPTHERPLPPALLAFLPQFYGYGRVKTVRLQEGESLRGGTPVRLLDVLAGVSPDYAIVAQKAGGDPRSEAMAQLDAAFAVQYGVTLNELAERHERRWEARVQHAQGVAEAARRAALGAEAAAHQSLERMLILQGQLKATEKQLDAMYVSRSWRITRPIRWVGEQRLALREQGAAERARRFTRKALSVTARRTMSMLESHPGARALVVKAVRAAGLDGFASRLRTRLAAGDIELPATPPLGPGARRVHLALRQAIARRHGLSTAASSSKED